MVRSSEPTAAMRQTASRLFVVAVILVLSVGCLNGTGSRPVLVGGGPSALPNLGLSAHASVSVHEGRRIDTWLEVEVTRQFLDDSDFADDGNPSAGDWDQLRVGGRYDLAAGEDRWWMARTGLTWFHARGKPNIVDQSGHYLGLYLELGFETAVTKSIRVGPGLAVLGVWDEDDGRELVPQLTWRILWCPNP